VLHGVQEKMNILQTIKTRKDNWIGHICFLKHVTEEKTEGRIEVTGRRGIRQKQLPDDLKDTKGP